MADDLAAAKIDLLPVAGEVQPRCSCPDWAEPCKHSAAVCYLVADTLDERSVSSVLDAGTGAGQLARGAACQAGRSRGQCRRPRPGKQGRRGYGRLRCGARHDLADRRCSERAGRVGALGVGVDRWFSARASHPASTVQTREADRIGAGSPGRFGVHLDVASDDWRATLRNVPGSWRTVSRSTGLELSMGEDLARRAAAMLSPGGEQGEIVELASLAGVPARDLLNQALAWRDGGSEGLFVLLEGWDAPRDSMVRGRTLLGGKASVPAQPGDARGATTPSRPGRSLVPVPPVGTRRRLGRVDA